MFDCHPGVDKRLVANATSKNMLNSSEYYTLYKHKTMQKMGFPHLKHEGLACQCTSTVSPSLSEGAKVGDTMPLDIASDNRFSSGDMYSPQASQTCNTNDQLPYFYKNYHDTFSENFDQEKVQKCYQCEAQNFSVFFNKRSSRALPMWFSKYRDFAHF